MNPFQAIRKRNVLEFPRPPTQADQRGIGCVFYDLLQSHKGKLAQIYGPTGEKDTYDELLKRSVRVSIAMKKMGIQTGDFISLCTYNHLDSCTPLIASFFIGAIVAAVDPTLSLEETVQLLQQTPPKLIFVHPEAVEMIEKSIDAIGTDTKIVVFGDTTKHIPFANFLQPSEEENNFKPVPVKSLKDTAIIFFSSGTTGLPKGICVTHYALVRTAKAAPKPAFNTDLSLSFASPYWTIFLQNLNGALVYGGTRLIYPKFDPKDPWHLFNYRVTTIFLNTVQILAMIGQERPKNLDISGLGNIFLGSARLTLNQILKARETFSEVRVHQAYGLTEVWGVVTIFIPILPKHMELMAKKPTSCGTGLPGMSFKIVDPETEEVLGPDQQGELRLKTEMQLSGYHNRDSSEIWDSDGWLKTGDLAYYDEDHCFYIVDRIKEMFKYQCWHITPAQIENVILTHPAVEMAIVIGISHEIDGNHPMGIVKIKPNHPEVTPEQIKEYVDERVQDRQKLRGGVKIVDNFPMTVTGKVARNKLRTMVSDGLI